MLKGAPLSIDGAGVWVVGRGGVKRWQPTLPPLEELPPRPEPPVVYAARAIVDVHELRACLTCTARVDETCHTTSGAWCDPHAGRLVSRRCSCGELVVGNARMCPPCAHASHLSSQRASVAARRAIARALQREVAA